MAPKSAKKKKQIAAAAAAAAEEDPPEDPGESDQSPADSLAAQAAEITRLTALLEEREAAHAVQLAAMEGGAPIKTEEEAEDGSPGSGPGGSSPTSRDMADARLKPHIRKRIPIPPATPEEEERRVREHIAGLSQETGLSEIAVKRILATAEHHGNHHDTTAAADAGRRRALQGIVKTHHGEMQRLQKLMNKSSGSEKLYALEQIKLSSIGVGERRVAFLSAKEQNKRLGFEVRREYLREIYRRSTQLGDDVSLERDADSSISKYLAQDALPDLIRKASDAVELSTTGSPGDITPQLTECPLFVYRAAWLAAINEAVMAEVLFTVSEKLPPYSLVDIRGRNFQISTSCGEIDHMNIRLRDARFQAIQETMIISICPGGAEGAQTALDADEAKDQQAIMKNAKSFTAALNAYEKNHCANRVLATHYDLPMPLLVSGVVRMFRSYLTLDSREIGKTVIGERCGHRDMAALLREIVDMLKALDSENESLNLEIIRIVGLMDYHMGLQLEVITAPRLTAQANTAAAEETVEDYGPSGSNSTRGREREREHDNDGGHSYGGYQSRGRSHSHGRTWKNCWICDKAGHRAIDCRHREKEMIFVGTDGMIHEMLCHTCAEMGHTSRFCPGAAKIKELKQTMREKTIKSAKANVARSHKTNKLSIADHRSKVRKQAREAKAAAMSAAAAEESEYSDSGDSEVSPMSARKDWFYESDSDE